ncbi:MAG: ribosome silencing factor [Muribaculaceae bacterium]|nr:ribosome silencing factor [Muribaculaceae bacterium]
MQEKINLLPEIINSIQEKKGKKITIIDLEDISGASADKFVICEGRSTSQVSAIADAVREDLLKNTGKKPYNYDGYRNSEWIIIDYGDIMVHIFLPEIRMHYNLEDLWSDGKFTHIHDLD